jgi:hypothetical protein
MSWHVRQVETWHQLINQFYWLSNLSPDHTKVTFLYRGQANASWSLRSSLSRMLFRQGIDELRGLSLEQRAVGIFKSQAHLHIGNLDRPLFGDQLLFWWPLMQHHRAPTRLVDWTESPYVGAYFAAEDHWDSDGVIWVILARDLMDGAMLKFPTLKDDEHAEFLSACLKPGAPECVNVIRPDPLSNRMVAQQGWFTLCSNILADQAQAIPDGIESDRRQNLLKIVIPKRLKPEILLRLRMMNITASSLFPGVDGLGRSIEEFIRAGTAPLLRDAPDVDEQLKFSFDTWGGEISSDFSFLNLDPSGE